MSGLIPIRRMTPADRALMMTMTGVRRRESHRIMGPFLRAIRSALMVAADFGVISPKIRTRTVRMPVPRPTI